MQQPVRRGRKVPENSTAPSTESKAPEGGSGDGKTITMWSSGENQANVIFMSKKIIAGVKG